MRHAPPPSFVINSFQQLMQRRRLPHRYPEGQALFLTWHLHGSVPASRFPVPHNLSAGRAFVWIDRYLDTARTGPLWLQREEIARLVVGAIHYSAQQLRHYDLEAYVIMANHVHLLVWPQVPASKFLCSLKGHTARAANKVLGRTGNPFWQKESYDHWVRDSAELERIRHYIEENPVRASLVQRPQDYPWSSATRP